MRLGFDFEADNLRRPIHRERTPTHEPQPVEKEPLVKPGPLDERMHRLSEQAEQNRFPEIPRRTYERRPGPELAPEKKPAERHVRSRHHLPLTIPKLRLRAEEKRLLAEAGRFRVLSLKDAAKNIYDGDERGLRSDLQFLGKHDLVSVDIINARRDGRARLVERIEVVTLTRQGERLARLTNTFEPGQRLYHGLVKPREVEHDSQIYRAYLKEWGRIEREGGQHPRVLLDFEIKSQVQKAIHAQRKADPKRDMDDIKQQVAKEHELPFIENQIQIPDARIEYELSQGSQTAHSDIEVVTAAYRPGHLRAKVQAGFHLYASGRDTGSISARIEAEHHLLDHVLDL